MGPPRRETASPKRIRVGRNVNAWLNPSIGAALDAYLEVTEPRTSATATVELSLKEFLIRRGTIDLALGPFLS
jgi:hypothetical protein